MPTVTRVVRTQLSLEPSTGSCQVLGIPPAAATQSAAITGRGLPSPPKCQQLWANSFALLLDWTPATHTYPMNLFISGALLPQGPSPGWLGPLVASSGIAAFPTRSPRVTARMP